MGINQYRETALHLALKRHIAEPADQLEVSVDGYIVDIRRDDLLIEVQTGNFAAMKTKLAALLPSYRVLLVYPISVARWLVTLDANGEPIKRRKSPKRGHVTHLFHELIYLPDEIVKHPNFRLLALMIRDEEIRIDDGRGSWRRRGVSIRDRRLVDVIDSCRFDSVMDYVSLLPPELPSPFTTADLASAIKQPRRTAQKMAYCLHRLALLQRTAKRGNAHCYIRSSSTP